MLSISSHTDLLRHLCDGKRSPVTWAWCHIYGLVQHWKLEAPSSSWLFFSRPKLSKLECRGTCHGFHNALHEQNQRKIFFTFKFHVILFCVERTISISFMLKRLNRRITAQELIFQKSFGICIVWLRDLRSGLCIFRGNLQIALNISKQNTWFLVAIKCSCYWMEQILQYKIHL